MKDDEREMRRTASGGSLTAIVHSKDGLGTQERVGGHWPYKWHNLEAAEEKDSARNMYLHCPGIKMRTLSDRLIENFLGVLNPLLSGFHT